MYYQSTGSHPYEHKIRLKSAASPVIPGFGPAKPLPVTNVQIAPRTAFEMERPQTQGSHRIVVINTSFKGPYQHRNANNKKRVPTFPKLATDPTPPRNYSRQTNFSVMSARRQSGNSSYRHDVSSASNRLSANMIQSHRDVSAQSDRQTGSAQLTTRQSNTFTQYAKYNDFINSTKAREKASENNITSNINDFSVLVPKPAHPELLSSEKHLWISNWVESTSAALKLNQFMEDETSVGHKPLSVIQEH